MMDLALRDKVVVITGASGGIGRAFAEAFAAQGARLALQGHRSWDSLDAWLSEQPWNDNALAHRADVTSPEYLEALFERVLERWGRVDVCLANAGIWPPENYPFHRAPEERVRRVIETNLMGAIWTARSFLSALERSGPREDGHGANLIFTGSTAGEFGERHHAEYATSKAALVGLVRSLKNEIVDLDPYGRVNLIQPGWTVTHMARPALDQPGTITKVVRTMPLRQLARAEDIATTALSLASPAMSRHVSGQTITVAGGMEGRVLWEPDQVNEDTIRERLES